MDDYNERAIYVIEEYISKKKGTVAMENIHRRVFDEQVTFSTWKEVKDRYKSIDFDPELFENFLLTAREIVEGGLDRISEAYFNINKPDELTTDVVTGILDQYLFDNRQDAEEPDGFDYEVDNDDIVQASYIYADVSTDITATGQIEETTQEDSVSFRVNPSRRLIVVESTYPPDVQRMKGILRRHTSFAVTICGSLTSDPDEANKRVSDFEDSFVEISFDPDDEGKVTPEQDDGIPRLEAIEEVMLYNAGSDDEQIERIDYEGSNLLDHDIIQERLKEDYVMRGLSASVWFNGDPFTIAFSGSDMMGYAKVEEIQNYPKASVLMDDLRDRFLEHFGDL